MYPDAMCDRELRMASWRTPLPTLSRTSCSKLLPIRTGPHGGTVTTLVFSAKKLGMHAASLSSRRRVRSSVPAMSLSTEGTTQFSRSTITRSTAVQPHPKAIWPAEILVKVEPWFHLFFLPVPNSQTQNGPPSPVNPSENALDRQNSTRNHIGQSPRP